MIFQKANLDDVRKIYEIELENYGLEEATELESFQEIIDYSQTNDDYSLIILKSEDVVGFYCTIQEEAHIELVDIAIDKSLQNKGFGKKLLNYCLQQNRGNTVRLKVRPDNRSAISLYQSMGFSKIETLEKYYDDVDGLRFEIKSIT